MKHDTDATPTPPAGEYEVVVAEDGRVIFRTATAAMLEVAHALAPRDPGVRRRRPRRRAQSEGEKDEIRTTE